MYLETIAWEPMVTCDAQRAASSLATHLEVVGARCFPLPR
jgi:hypothetical protein